MDARKLIGRSRLALAATWLAARALGAVSPRVGGAIASRLWFTPWRIAPSDATRQREREWLTGADPLEFTVNDVRLSGWTVGRGPTVLLIHGWGDRAASLGAMIEPLTSAGLRVVGVDLPGHGSSPSGPTDLYSLAAAVRAVGSQVSARAVVAHSMGGAVVLLALRDGMALDALALVAPAVRLENALAPFQRMFRLSDGTMDGLRSRIEDRFGQEVWRDVAADRLVADLVMPGLVVHDRTDTQVGHADARMLVDAWTSATLVTTDGLGHTRILRDPDVTGRIAEFLSEQLHGPDARECTGVPASHGRPV